MKHHAKAQIAAVLAALCLFAACAASSVPEQTAPAPAREALKRWGYTAVDEPANKMYFYEQEPLDTPQYGQGVETMYCLREVDLAAATMTTRRIPQAWAQMQPLDMDAENGEVRTFFHNAYTHHVQIMGITKADELKMLADVPGSWNGSGIYSSTSGVYVIEPTGGENYELGLFYYDALSGARNLVYTCGGNAEQLLGTLDGSFLFTSIAVPAAEAETLTEDDWYFKWKEIIETYGYAYTLIAPDGSVVWQITNKTPWQNVRVHPLADGTVLLEGTAYTKDASEWQMAVVTRAGDWRELPHRVAEVENGWMSFLGLHENKVYTQLSVQRGEAEADLSYFAFDLATQEVKELQRTGKKAFLPIYAQTQSQYIVIYAQEYAVWEKDEQNIWRKTRNIAQFDEWGETEYFTVSMEYAIIDKDAYWAGSEDYTIIARA